MADNKRIDEILFVFNTDKASQAKTDAAFAKMRKGVVTDIQKIEKEFAQSATLASKLNQEVSKIGNQKAIDKLTRDVTKAKEGTDKWKKALEALEAQLKKVGATEDQIQGVAGNIAGASTGRQRINAGLGQAAISLKNQSAIQTPLGISTDAIAKMVALFANLPPVALPVLAVLGAIGVGFVAMESQLLGVKKQLDNAVVSVSAYYNAISAGTTTDEAKKEIEELNATLKSQQAELATLEGGFASGFNGLSEEIDRVNGVFGDTKIFSPQQAEGLKRLVFGISNLSGTDDKATASIEELRGKIEDTIGNIDGLTRAQEQGALIQNDLKKAREELTKAEEDNAKSVAQLTEQRNTLLKNEGQQVHDLTEERIIADLRELEDYNEQRQEQLERHVNSISAIDEAGQERLEAIHASGIDKIAGIDKRIGDLYDDLAGLEDTGADKREKVNRDYMQDELKELEKFRKDESRRTRDYYKDRDRLLEDLNNDLLDAEQENDVVRFVAAQKAAELELNRNAEDFDQETQDNQEDYLAQRTVEQQQLAEKLSDIQVEADSRRAEIQERIAEQQAAKQQVIIDIADQLAAERARILQSKIDAQAAFDEQRAKEQEAFDKRQEREAQDEARSDLKRQTKLASDLADIETKKQAEQAALNVLIAKVMELKLKAAAINIGSGSGGTGTGTNSSYTNTGGASISPFTFADGGIATKKTYGVFGERPGYNEALIPFRKSEGIENAMSRLGMGGGQPITVNLNGNIGNGVTRAEVTAELQMLGKTIVTSVAQARAA